MRLTSRRAALLNFANLASNRDYLGNHAVDLVIRRQLEVSRGVSDVLDTEIFFIKWALRIVITTCSLTTFFSFSQRDISLSGERGSECAL